jgi:hypothetical protein
MSDYGFTERYRWSDEHVKDRVYEVASTQLGAVDIERAAPEHDRKGVDWWAIVPGRSRLGIDVKKRSADWPDVDIETVSVVEKGKPGWSVNPTYITDFVLWIWPRRSLLVSFPQLRVATQRHVAEWERLYPQRGRDGQVRNSSSDGRSWHTRNVYVPEAVLLDAIYPELQAISLLPAKDVWRALPQHCFTCGKEPTSRFGDGSPKYDCSHDPVPLVPLKDAS